MPEDLCQDSSANLSCDPSSLRASRSLAAAVLALLLALLACGCQGDLCRSEEPSFQVDLSLDSSSLSSTIKGIYVTVQAGTFTRENISLDLSGKLDDGQTSFAVVLGASGEGGFEAEVLVVARDKSGKNLAWAMETFSGSGDGCNFFSMTLKSGDVSQADLDGDGESGATDCDDSDPCRSTKIKEKKDFCEIAKASFPALPAACIKKLAKEGKTAVAPFCGDGVDQDCDGQDTACVTDNDCDGISPPTDCDDNDKNIKPGATEKCNDTKDNNCDGVVNEGCIPCDVDGDKYAAPAADCSGTTEVIPKTDTDDYDAGIYPTVTSKTGGLEGTTWLNALREFCGYTETKNSTSAKKKRQRDVDHDGDGKAASADGCPTETCDADGDGYQNSSCNPPKSVLDCDDSDPQTFPGAPDKCGDGKAQNCQADHACAGVTDLDKDGYALPASINSAGDCNDSDAKIHPWATEICDKKDNDCDDLTDEGNPDHLGKLIPTNQRLCNNDNDGVCADPSCTPGTTNCSSAGRTLSGTCACSAQTPKETRDDTNRVKCTGESLLVAASPRCFAGLSKTGEKCDSKDWDCDGKSLVKGQSFMDKDKACGTSVGNCKEGKVTDCDLSKTVANYLLVKAVDPDFNAYWVCSGDLPFPEVCNGKDDDCNGLVPSNEGDTDSDKYISCSGCTKGSGSKDLLSTLTGCADCNDKSSTVYPGAQEMCNNIDDNCKNGIVDDGSNQCVSPLPTCCSKQKACRNTTSDISNCGGCGAICDTKVSSKCTSSKCVCGSSSSACSTGYVCSTSGTCDCKPASQGGLCSGCCDSNTCLFPGSTQSVSKCGTAGGACKDCRDTNTCTSDACTSAGTCTNTNVANRTSCDSATGKCASGSCCKGCISGSSGSTCQVGTTTTYCGKGGIDCTSCSTTNQCKTASCATGACVVSNKANGTTCNDGLYCKVSETCQNGTCTGSDRDCSSLDDQCNKGSCNESTDQCVKSPKANGTTCNDGLYCTVSETCQNGSCTGGTARNCSAVADACNNGVCNESTNQCVKSPKTDGTSCGSGKQCISGLCLSVDGGITTPDT